MTRLLNLFIKYFVSQFTLIFAGEASPEVVFLQTLLKHNHNISPANITEPSLRAIDPSGHQVSLSVHRNSPDGTLAISIHTPTVCLLSQLRIAVCKIVKVKLEVLLATKSHSQNILVMDLLS